MHAVKNRTASLRARLFWAFALVTLIAVALPAFLFRNALYQDRIETAGKEALTRAVLAKSILESEPEDAQVRALFRAASALSFRMTLADRNGIVLLDSHVGGDDLAALDNHGDRPEIEAAHSLGAGRSLRFSNTLGHEAVYAAVELENGGVLRIAVPLADIRHSFEDRLPALLGAALGAALFCLLLSALFTARVRNYMEEMAGIVASVSRSAGNERRRLRGVRWREMQPLADAVNHMADTIEEHMAAIADKQGQLETILDSMHEGVLVLDPGGGIRSWNKALAGLFPDIAREKGKALIEGIPLPALQRRVDALLGLKNGADEPDEEAIHFEMPAGRFLVAQVSRPVTRNDSLGAVIVIYNATEIMRLERVRRDFVSNVSHELRTPLTAIAGYAEILADAREISGEYKNFAGIIHKHAGSLSRVITGLLTLARLENSREAVPLAPMDPAAAANEAVVAVQEQAMEKNIGINLELAPDRVLANAGLLTQVFRNLLENACRYSPQNGQVRLSSRSQGNLVLFCVSDNGPGIPAPALPRIFERFYQVKKERNSGSAGIGLAICKHIIERHNGRIWAESPYQDAATAMLFTLAAAPAQERDKE